MRYYEFDNQYKNELKTLRAVLGNDHRDFLKYIKYDAKEKKLVSCNGKALYVLDLTDNIANNLGDQDGMFELSGDLTIVERDYDPSKYPDYKRVIPSNPDTTIKLEQYQPARLQWVFYMQQIAKESLLEFSPEYFEMFKNLSFYTASFLKDKDVAIVMRNSNSLGLINPRYRN